jgi:hypothetical protein
MEGIVAPDHTQWHTHTRWDSSGWGIGPSLNFRILCSFGDISVAVSQSVCWHRKFFQVAFYLHWLYCKFRRNSLEVTVINNIIFRGCAICNWNAVPRLREYWRTVHMCCAAVVLRRAGDVAPAGVRCGWPSVSGTLNRVWFSWNVV